MHTLSSALLIKALDGLSARAEAIASNVANAQSPHYAPVKVTFEEALAAAAHRGSRSVAAVRPQFVTEASDGVRLDIEIADSAATAGRYAALVEVLNRELQIRSLAQSGGRS